MFNAGFAMNNLDVGRIIKKAGSDLRKKFEKGDEVFIFGFSRGAAIARRFATKIYKYIPEDKMPDETNTLIRFLGVFDTVAAIGAPNLDDDNKPKSDVVFENGTISPYIKEALHLVSIDENRIAFQPTLMNKEDRVEEIWFPGAHADVGGGFWYDGLSDIALDFMIEEIGRRDLGINVLQAAEVDYSKLKAPDRSYQIDLEDVFVKPNCKGKAHPKDRWLPFAKATLDKRLVRVNINDEPSSSYQPTLHHSVVERITAVTDYRPKNLKAVKHTVLGIGGETLGFSGLSDHIVV